MEYLYHYKAEVVSVYDGDTIRVIIDLGFGFSNRGSRGKGTSIRLYGINTPEVRGVERPEGLIAKKALLDLIEGKTVTLRTIKDKTGKYGRYLGIIILEDGTNVNDWLVDNGYAVKAEY